MVKLACTSLLAVAIAVTSVSAVELHFKRYAQVGCSDANHIPKDTDLHDPHCKSFDSDEPAFYSFKADPHDDEGDLDTKLCKAIVYAEKDCQGEGRTYGDMRQYENSCADTTMPGRSVRISCEDRPEPIYRLPYTSAVTEANTWTVTKHVHPAYSEETTTMYLVPSHQHDWW